MIVRTPNNLSFRQYQYEGAYHLLSGQKKLLLDDMGVGKTPQAVVACASLRPRRCLVICPPATKWNWAKEIELWTWYKVKVQVLEGMMDTIDDDATHIVCSYSILSSPKIYMMLKSYKWGVTICDEIHFCKNTKANRTQAVLGFRNTKKGGLAGVIKNSVYFWGLSGSLMPNTPIDLWQVFRSMGKQHLGKRSTYEKYIRHYCSAFKMGGRWNTAGASNLEELRGCLFDSGFALRRTKTEVLKELPGKQFTLWPLDKGMKVGASAKWVDKIKHADFSKSDFGMGAGEFAKARAELALEKIPACIDFVKARAEGKLVIFTWHRSVTDSIAEALGDQAVKYYGGMTPKSKEKSKAAFINGEAKFFVVNYVSGGTGLDGLQHVCAHAIFVEIPWTFAEIAQASDRLDRFGQTNKVTIDLLVAKDSPEGYIMKTVFKKQKIFNDLLLTM